MGSGCPYEGRMKVPPVGSPSASLVIVAEAPGPHEFEYGIPLCGPSGKLLYDHLFKDQYGSYEDYLDLRVSSTYITNVILCDIKKPPKQIFEHCVQRLKQELDSLQPNDDRVLLLLGAVASQAVLGFKAHRGFFYDTPWGPAFYSMHPAYYLRVLERTELFRLDMEKFKKGFRVPTEPDIIVVNDPGGLSWLASEISSLPSDHFLAFDCETTGFDPFKDEIICVSLCFDDKTTFVVPMTPAAQPALMKIFQSPCRKTGANFKFDLKFLRKAGFNVRNVYFDVLLAQHVLNENFPLDLTSLTSLYTNLPPYMSELERYIKEHKVKSYADIPREILYEYSGYDAFATYLVTQALYPRVKRQYGDVYWGVSVPLQRALVDVELRGIRVDMNRVDELTLSVRKEIQELEDHLFQTVGQEFNYRSTRQLGRVLYHDLGLPVVAYTSKGQPSTNEAALRRLLEKAQQGQLSDEGRRAVELLLQLRKRQKVLSTYLKGPRGGVTRFVKDDGRVHPVFNVHGTHSGRLSSNDPPIQTIPKTALRTVFTVDSGYKFLEFDLSQAELRVVAHASQCQTMLDAFAAGRDIHAETASRIFRVPVEKVTPLQRHQAKFVNFGVCLDGDTEVVTSTGYKKIRDVRVGERVLTHKGNWKRVVNTHRVRAARLIEITTATKKKIRCTPDHEMLTPKGFVRAGALELGCRLVSLKSFLSSRLSSYDEIVSIREIPFDGFVYDLTVEGDHSFVANGLFTHNCYGRGAQSVAAQFNMSLEEAEALLDSFFSVYPEIRDYMDRVVGYAKRNRRLCNYFGRCRHFGTGPFLPEWERQALSYISQSTIADFTNQTLALLVYEFQRSGLDAYVIAQLHDAIMVECQEDIVDDVVTLVKTYYERPVADTDLIIPVEVTVGDCWQGGDLLFEE